jgi:hypothetical protein
MTIDKSQLYATFEKSHERQQKLTDMATRKALDLPLEDDVQITTNTTHHGISWLGAALLSATLLAGGGGAALGLMSLFGALCPSVPSTPGAHHPISPQEFKITFWAEDGKPIEVEK